MTLWASFRNLFPRKKKRVCVEIENCTRISGEKPQESENYEDVTILPLTWEGSGEICTHPDSIFPPTGHSRHFRECTAFAEQKEGRWSVAELWQIYALLRNSINSSFSTSHSLLPPFQGTSEQVSLQLFLFLSDSIPHSWKIAQSAVLPLSDESPSSCLTFSIQNTSWGAPKWARDVW